MRSILHQLYYGDLSPATQYEGRLEEYRQLREKHQREYQAFLQGLEPRQRKDFIRILDQQFATIPMEYADAFADGFQLGAKMMLAVLAPDLPGQD